MATNNLYTTRTAALKATKADINKLNVKKLFLGGENILDIIKNAIPTIKHSQDTRETVTENDLWGQYIETKADGTIVVHDDWVTNPNSSSGAWNTSITKVEDNKAYVGDTFFANIQTERIKSSNVMFLQCSKLTSFSSDLSSLTNGSRMFFSCSQLATFNADLSNLTNGQAMFLQCSQLASFSSNLSNLTNGSFMFNGCSQLNSFTFDLGSLTNGTQMFYNCTKLTSFSSDLSNLTNGTQMFTLCSKLTSFSSNLSNLTNGDGMFSGCSQLNSFTFDLGSLTNGNQMFYNCTNLTSFNGDLSSLTNGSQMFYNCNKLTSFNGDLSSLTNGQSMFSVCYKLTSFNGDLSNLTNGNSMFDSCVQLTSFNGDLSSLTNGYGIFGGCKLDTESVMYIADTIKDITAEKQLYIDGTIPYVTYDSTTQKYSATKGFMSDGTYVYTYNNPQPYFNRISASDVGKLTLSINVTNDATTIQQQLEDFAQETTFGSWDDLKTHFSNKGWTVAFQYGGTNTSITYDLRNGEQIIPCQIFAKLVQVEDKDKDSAEYCTEDASKFYNIDWGHDVTDTSSYTQFDSLEDAMASWNVFPKENIITTEE